MFNVLLIPMPTLFCLAMLYVQCGLLDGLKDDEFKQKRMYLKHASVSLGAALVFLGFFISQVPKLILMSAS